MLGEAVAAALVGLAGLMLVLQPLFGSTRKGIRPPEPLDPEETPRGVALTALKEIDFDRETGKLSESDYHFLKAKYTAIALEALRSEEGVQREQPRPDHAVVCASCGPRPERDPIFCSSCGLRLVPGAADLPASAGLARSAPVAAIPPKPLQAG
jgi:hypothetical protein